MQTIMIVEGDPDIRDGVRIALDCNRVWVDEQEADLTETEYKILKLLMQSPQRIFPVQVIYETVWGEPYFYVSNGTVMVHIRNLRQQQLDKEHRSEAAALCSGALFFAPYYTFSTSSYCSFSSANALFAFTSIRSSFRLSTSACAACSTI